MYLIHFIGKQYYSIAQFIKEAKQYRISRKIAPNMLKKLSFGDIILLAQGDSKGSLIFGFFIFTSIFGLKHELFEKLEQEKIISLQSNNPIPVNRGCGSYVITASYGITNQQRFFEFIKEQNDEDLKGVLIGGTFYELSDLLPEKEIHTNIPFQQGFRFFDFESFKKEYLKQKENKKRIRIIGMFYTKEIHGNIFTDSDPKFFEIKDYQKNTESRKRGHKKRG